MAWLQKKREEGLDASKKRDSRAMVDLPRRQFGVSDYGIREGGLICSSFMAEDPVADDGRRPGFVAFCCRF